MRRWRIRHRETSVAHLMQEAGVPARTRWLVGLTCAAGFVVAALGAAWDDRVEADQAQDFAGRAHQVAAVVVEEGDPVLVEYTVLDVRHRGRVDVPGGATEGETIMVLVADDDPDDIRMPEGRDTFTAGDVLGVFGCIGAMAVPAVLVAVGLVRAARRHGILEQ
jgi:hypothetical protein